MPARRSGRCIPGEATRPRLEALARRLDCGEEPGAALDVGALTAPLPRAYEASMGSQTTDELAVMMDTFAPLVPTPAALEVEDEDFHLSFR